MKPKIYRSLIFGGVLCWTGSTGYSGVNAQVSADNTMSTKVNSSNNVFEISGGTTKGDNLFHSFEEFSLPSGNTAQFNNSVNIGNIIGRVTGGSISEINGLIRAEGDANLILINPTGINFGADARLDIGGSFLGSTASSVVFGDGTVFSATELDDPILTISVPVGLQLGQNSGAINIEGEGHNLGLETTVFSPLTKGGIEGLKANSGETIALVGSNLNLSGGTLTAESGRIELGSVARGIVKLTGDRWSLDYSGVTLFDDINLTRQSLADVSGIGSGSINLQGRQITIRDGSAAVAQSSGDRPAEKISVNATELLNISNGGISAAVREGVGGAIEINANALNLSNGGRIVSDNFGSKDGGHIEVNSNSLSISDRSYISSTSFGSGTGGSVILDIADSVSITGTGYEQFQQTFQVDALAGSLVPGTRGTGIFIGTTNGGTSGNLSLDTNSLSIARGGVIFSPVFAGGSGGNIEIDADDVEISGSGIQINAGSDSTSSAVAGNMAIDTVRLVLREGGTIVNATFGDASGGNIDINAEESVSLENTPDNSLIFTGIYAKTITGNGDGGDISLTTERLKIDNALISSNTGIFTHNGLAFDRGGNGGNISIRAVDTIEISGIPIDARFASGISSSTVSNGAAGNVEIFTDKLLVEDGSEIAATTIGSGDGGDLTIVATDSIELIGTTTANNMQRGGLIAASGRAAFPQQQASGASGDISVTAGSLTIERGAGIDVQSIDKGSAGNLNIDVDNLVSLDDRGKISAETDSGTGGNIEIAAENIFWLGNSTTTATASNDANGGNISIQAENLIALESSRLTADAEAGTGGNINVDAIGLFICDTCRVGASSKLGIDGVVNIKTLNFNPDFKAVDLPVQLAQPESAVDLACASDRSGNASSLIVTGRGGLPPRPSEVLDSKSMVNFDDTIQAEASATEVAAELPAPARSWHVDSEGTIILTARSGEPQFNSPSCHAR